MLTLSTSAYANASLCLRKYWYSNVEKIIPKPANISVPIRKGLWLHKMLQTFHVTGSFDAALTEVNDLSQWAEERGVPVEAINAVGDDVVDLFDQYVKFWKTQDQDVNEWRPFTVERDGHTVLGPEVSMFWYHEDSDTLLRATPDLPVMTRNGKFFVEHKSTGDIPDASWRGVDPQTALQLFIAEQNGVRMEGAIFNYLWTKKPAVPEPVKKGDRFGATVKETTTSSFWKGADALSRVWKGDNALLEEYLEDASMRLINDGAWFQRFVVYRPMDMLVETMADVLSTIAAINQAEALGHYRRSFHPITCKRFCQYSTVCMMEYITGKEATGTREQYYMPDTGEREAR